VQERSQLGSAGEDEALELRQLGVEAIAVVLEPVDLFLCDAEPRLVLHRHGEVGAEIEELVLDTQEDVPDLVRAVACEREPDERVQLVRGPVGRDSRVELGDPRAVSQRRLAFVASASVDPGQPYRLVALAGHQAVPCATGSSRSWRPRIERAMTRRWISLVPS
jgi:hypothetical protein